MRWIKRIERLVFPLAAAVLVASLVLAIFGVGMREMRNRRLYLELEAYRALTALTDLVRSGGLNREDFQRVLAFGLYAMDGKAIYRHGDAPEHLEAVGPETQFSNIEIEKDAIILQRLLGYDLPGRRPSPAMMGRMRREMPMIAEPVPAMAYIKFSTGNFTAWQASLRALLIVFPLALIGLYAVLIAVYYRYLAAADREARNRELVELGEAARTIVHEIKNPLGVIRIQCGLLRREFEGAGSSGIEIIEDEVLRLNLMADRIRTYLGQTEGPSETVNVSRLFLDCADRYTGAVNFNIRLTGDELLVIDGGKLVEAIDNIISNAREAMSGQDELPEVEIFCKQQRLIIQVSDRGPGVASGIRKKLFEPFFTTKPRGTGLGLALARKTVESAGGAISYSERPGGGSVFTIALPLSSPKRT